MTGQQVLGSALVSGARVAILVGVVALGGTTAYLMLGGDKSTGSHATPAPARNRTAAQKSPTTGKAAIAAPAGPSLATAGSAAEAAAEVTADPSLPEVAPPPAPISPPTASAIGASAESFGKQLRDPAWAGKTETELRNRIPKLGTAQLEATECRQDQCMLTLGGSQDDVAAILARLESPTKGITTFATSVTLTAPEQQGDRLVIRAYAQFSR
ncbi:MAG: hypothetical protein SFX73_27370 [Kofleriaceae bacterium]|nr:hypothetical protein [Kofleriaceae bacterium]